MLVVRPGETTRSFTEGSVTFVELRRSWLCIPLDLGLRFDVLLPRHYRWLRERLAIFAPGFIHICGPGDIGMLSAALSHKMQVPKIPLVAAWHTNVHQYACLRLGPLLHLFPCAARAAISSRVEAAVLRLTARFYRIARPILAPNTEILSHLTRLTGKPGRLLPHGVDTEMFHPPPCRSGGTITLGYVGRLTPEKNVRFLVELAGRLPADVLARVRFLIVGDGSEREWLEQLLPNARFTGILRGPALAAAYAEMDVFLFPSRSDTFGLVILEAMSTGLPVVSFQLSGPMSAVKNGTTGLTAATAADFAGCVTGLARDHGLRNRLGAGARHAALAFGWDTVFESIYLSYATIGPAPVSAKL